MTRRLTLALLIAGTLGGGLATAAGATAARPQAVHHFLCIGASKLPSGPLPGYCLDLNLPF